MLQLTAWVATTVVVGCLCVCFVMGKLLAVCCYFQMPQMQ